VVPARLAPDERVDHRILKGIIDGWLLDGRVPQVHRRKNWD
jgi:hypothetical protein